MNIRVEVNTLDEVDIENNVVIETLNLDNNLICDNDTTMLEEIVSHMKRSLIGLGFHENSVNEYFVEDE